MSERTLVSIEPRFGEGVSFKLLKAAADLPDPFVPYPFDCSVEAMPDWTSQAAVCEHGAKILRELRRHPAVSEALRRAAQAPNGKTHSIYFQLLAPEVERLCWEALYDTDTRRFFALDRRLAIARVAESLIERQVPIRAFEPPVRVLAVLAALGFSAEPEWRQLRDAAVEARNRGLDVELRVLCGERSLVERIESEQLDWVTVGPTPQRTRDLESVVFDFAPQVLHFFCHGSSSYGVTRLEIGTVLDFDDRADRASFQLDSEALAAFPGIERTWIVILNCCLGGQASEETHSMAHDLVSRGIPAAIGMLERVEAMDAHEFSGAFHRAFLERVRVLLEEIPDGSEASLEWAETLFDPRRTLSERHGNDPANHRQWLLPVLYVRPESFLLRRLPQGVSSDSMEEMRRRASMVAGLLRSLTNAPDEARDELLHLLDDVPA
ncbi:MAG: CHAT domain-containing protein, partial [Planctomycetes bacterium]|nr:CHAT domain-containing protein [Planctomycetota bacterium]